MEFHHQFPAGFTPYPGSSGARTVVARDTKQTPHAASGRGHNPATPSPTITSSHCMPNANRHVNNTCVAGNFTLHCAEEHRQARTHPRQPVVSPKPTTATTPAQAKPKVRTHNPYANVLVLDAEALHEAGVVCEDSRLSRSPSSLVSSGSNTPGAAVRNSVVLDEQLASGLITPLSASPLRSGSCPLPATVYRRDPYSWRPCPSLRITVPRHCSPRQSPDASSFASSGSSSPAYPSEDISTVSTQSSGCSSLNTTGSDATDLELDGLATPGNAIQPPAAPQNTTAEQRTRPVSRPEVQSDAEPSRALTPVTELTTLHDFRMMVSGLLNRLFTNSPLEAGAVTKPSNNLFRKTPPAPRSAAWKRVLLAQMLHIEGMITKPLRAETPEDTAAYSRFTVMINFRTRNPELPKLLHDLGLLPANVAKAVRSAKFERKASFLVLPPLGDLGLKAFLEAEIFKATGLPAQVLLHEHRPRKCTMKK